MEISLESSKEKKITEETWVPQVLLCIYTQGFIGLYEITNHKTTPYYTHPEVDRIW